MQRESAAITPQFICSYAWKQPLARPALFQRAQKLLTRENLGADTSQAGPWKAFLAARERQLLASEIVEGFFSASRDMKPSSLVRPSILTSKLPADTPAKGLLASVLKQDAVSQDPAPDGAADLPIAA
jgi:hypothetical protein